MSGTLFWALGAIASTFLGTSTLTARFATGKFTQSLDPSAEVYYPGSEGFINASLRWSAAQTPQYDLIVKVASEGDVQKTVLSLAPNE